MKTYLILIPNHGVCNGIANEKSPYRAFLLKQLITALVTQ